MKIAESLYLEARIHSEDSMEAWLENEKTGKKLRIAQVFRHCGKWYVWSLFEGHEQPGKKEAVKHFNYIVSIVADEFRFLLNQ